MTTKIATVEGNEVEVTDGKAVARINTSRGLHVVQSGRCVMALTDSELRCLREAVDTYCGMIEVDR